MIHAFRLGPVSTSPAPSFAYAAVLPSGKVEVRNAPADPQGLAALREFAGEQPLACEPALAEAAKRLRMVVAPLPPEIMQVRALLAYELASGIDHGASRPEAIAALLKAAGAYWASKAWELIPPDEQLHVAFTSGRSLLQGEVSIQATDPAQPRLVLCDEPAAQARLEGLAGDARVAQLLKGAGLTVELAKEPAWATAVIEEAYRLPRVPMPERRRAGKVATVSTQDLVTAAVLLECVVAFADLAEGTEAEAEVTAATLRVKARIGPTPPDATSLRSSLAELGLTPVGPDEAVVPAPAAPAPTPAAPTPAPAPPAPAPAAPEEEALSPEELAAIVKGGDEPAAPAPAPKVDAEEALSAEELAAIVKGGDAPAAPAPAPKVDAEEALSAEELAAIVKGGDAPAAPAPAPEAAPAPEDDDKPLSPEELAALLKGASAPAAAVEPPAPPPAQGTEAPPPPPPAVLGKVEPVPAPAPATPTPVAAPATATPPATAASPEAAPAPEPEDDASAPAEGWLKKAWRALGGARPKAEPPPPTPKAPPAGPVKPGPKPAAKPAAKPTAKPAPAAPPVEAPPDPQGPFAAYARALKVSIPGDPPAVALGDREAAVALARQLAAGAVDREHFVSFPAVALQIIELVHGADADARGVAGFISRDPGLAADVLAVANSAAFRGVSEVGSVREAVARLGLQEVGRVASAVSARALLVPAQAGGGPPSTRLFTRAVAVATAASATALQLRGAHSDQVWLAGLLHDVGLALGATALNRLRAGGAPGVPAVVADLAVEQAHVEIGATALRAWGLPQYIADVCARHHDEALPAGPDLVDLHLVRLTSALARLSEPEVAARAAAEIVQSARALGFDVHAVRALAADLKAAEQRAGVLLR